MAKDKQVTDHFKNSIQEYLNKKAETDEVPKGKLEHKDFSIDTCIDYILTTVQNSKVKGYTDDEVYQMAIHYLDEYQNEEFDIKDGISMQVVVNHTVQLTEEEIQEAKEEAKKKILDEAREKMTKKPKKKKVVVKEENKDINQPSQSALLF